MEISIYNPDEQIVGPNDISINGNFMDTVWQNSEKETVARNIIMVCRVINTKNWQSFCWEEYKELCSHDVTDGEKCILEDFVKTGYLVKMADEYYVTSFFIHALKDYIDCKV